MSCEPLAIRFMLQATSSRLSQLYFQLNFHRTMINYKSLQWFSLAACSIQLLAASLCSQRLHRVRYRRPDRLEAYRYNPDKDRDNCRG